MKFPSPRGGVMPFLVVLLVIGAFVIGSLYTKVQILEKGNSTVAGSQTGNAAQPQAPPSVNIKDVDIKSEPFIGQENAPVTMAYWLDYQCPFCKKFETDVLSKIITDYVDKGKLKIVFKDFQFLGPDSQDAGLVENAIWELYPDQFAKWHQAMYEAQDGENAGFGNMESILKLIKDKLPGIDATKIKTQIDAKKSEYQKELDDDKAEGGKFGVTGTPGFVIGTQSIQGAEPLNVFTQVIDAELGKK